MDIFEAVNSRIACRWFLNTPVDLNIVRNLIEGAAPAASNGNHAQNVYPPFWDPFALAGEGAAR